MKRTERRSLALTAVFLLSGLLAGLAAADVGQAQTCNRTVVANVVALDQNYFLNRLGSLNNLGMIYALERDVYTNEHDPSTGEFIGRPCNKAGVQCTPGNVVLRPDKRPRPIALRASKGDCLEIRFRNLLNPLPLALEQPATRSASAHVTGLPLAGGIGNDGSFVGRNASSLCPPNGAVCTYKYYAIDENVYMITNMGATTGAEGGGGSLTFGLYGVVIVEPGIPGSAAAAAGYYRSHVTNEEMLLATTARTQPVPGKPGTGDQPVIDYEALYPNAEPFITENKANIPVLNMLCTPAAAALGACSNDGVNIELVHSDAHAIVTGPAKGMDGTPGTADDWKFAPNSTYPSTATNPRQDLPFREAASVFGDEQFNVQSFPLFFTNPVLKHTLAITKDGFVINYGSGAIGPEIIANRLGVGPMWDCPECKAEEFFLTSWAVGDPGMWVDIPANGCIQNNLPLVDGVAVDPNVAPLATQAGCGPAGAVTPGVKATKTLFPDDPSTVHHAYIRDHFKFRNIHAGPFEHHIFHLHNNQWVFSPKSDKANYQDMQQVGPGSSYTMDITNEGAGNRNANPGDAIYHCHFYPHFAQGMWASLRMHDVLEEGTALAPRLDPNNPTWHRAAWALRDAPPAVDSRALPDGEVSPAATAGSGTCILNADFNGLCTGTPTPAVVPMPLYPMAPAPAVAHVDPIDPRRIVVAPNPVTGETNPGFPFYIAGLGGHRPPSPPLDLIHDGGLPRHVITGGAAIGALTRFDINKELEHVEAELVPEAGTAVELASFAFHEKRCHDTYYSDGTVAPCDTTTLNTLSKPYRGGFITNGLPPAPGAPHSDPCVDNKGNPVRAGARPEWNRADCSLARLDNTNPACTGFQLAETVEWGDLNPRPYKVANIQIDLVLNKKGWHMPQQRIISLWGDVADQYAGKLPPAPMTFRLNTLDCAEVWHSNLVPNFYELDDFQVRTPTDIIAQHSHMTKFDVASSDGAANLWNYEDGTMSPGEVSERIEAINAGGGLADPAAPGGHRMLTAQTHPFFEKLNLPFQTVTVAGCTGKTCGTRTSVQRWLADPVLDNAGIDRGIGNVFTHDHFGPSTFQQLGLYATIMAEPAGSVWRHNETGALLATRVGAVSVLTNDGGPTSWQAQIIPPAGSSSFNKDPYREFYFENSDFQQSYKRTWGGTIDGTSFLEAVAPTAREAHPVHIYEYTMECPGAVLRPCPMGIGGADQGTQVVNYRNEPLAARVFDPFNLKQAAGVQGDLSFAFASIRRVDPDLNVLQQAYVRNTIQCPSCIRKPGEGTCVAGEEPFCASGLPAPLFNPTSAGIGLEIINATAAQLSFDVDRFDPATPIMRVYEGDRVKIRMQVGATEESHHFSMHGAKWLMNYADPNSGWRNVQSMGISEQFQFDFPILGDLLNPGARAVDYLYSSNMSGGGLWDGEWGLMRSYALFRTDLSPLPNNVPGNAPVRVANRQQFRGVCPTNAPVRRYDVTAIRAADIPLPTKVGGMPTLIYNARETVIPDLNVVDPETGAAITVPGGAGPLHDPMAIMYVQTRDLPGLRNGSIKPEPLILRANAGDCIQTTLRNALPRNVPDINGIALNYTPIVDLCPARGCQFATGFDPLAPAKVTFNSNLLFPSANVGLHAQLVAYDILNGDGANVGRNAALSNGNVNNAGIQTVAPGASRTYTWYAGDLLPQRAGRNAVNLIPRPIEFGVVGLSPSDKLEQSSKGLMAALVVEPRGSRCTPDSETKAQATCRTSSQEYREFVAMTQSNVNMFFASPPAGVFADPANNYVFQPVPGFPTEAPLVGVADDTEDSGVKAVNYRTEPYWFRLKMPPGLPLGAQAVFDTEALYSNSLVAGEPGAGSDGDPETPVFEAKNGANFRFYFVEPAGNQRSHVPAIHGHVWQRTPHRTVGGTESAVIGDNPESQLVGSQEGYGPASHWNFVPPSTLKAGGPFGAAGDYLYRMQNPAGGYQGSWGLFRVE